MLDFFPHLNQHEDGLKHNKADVVGADIECVEGTDSNFYQQSFHLWTFVSNEQRFGSEHLEESSRITSALLIKYHKKRVKISLFSCSN